MAQRQVGVDGRAIVLRDLESIELQIGALPSTRCPTRFRQASSSQGVQVLR
jgi:hypothetical protein